MPKKEKLLMLIPENIGDKVLRCQVNIEKKV